jgi:hypothetical protein
VCFDPFAVVYFLSNTLIARRLSRNQKIAGCELHIPYSKYSQWADNYQRFPRRSLKASFCMAASSLDVMTSYAPFLPLFYRDALTPLLSLDTVLAPRVGSILRELKTWAWNCLELPVLLSNSWYMPRTREEKQDLGKRLILIESIKITFLQRSNSCPVTTTTTSRSQPHRKHTRINGEMTTGSVATCTYSKVSISSRALLLLLPLFLSFYIFLSSSTLSQSEGSRLPRARELWLLIRQ